MNQNSLTPEVLNPAGLQGAGWRDSILWPLLFLAVGLCFVVIPCAAGSMMPGDLADSRYNLTMLEIVYRNCSALLHGSEANFRDAPFFYPWPNTTHFSVTHWGDGVAYVVARALGADYYRAYQYWFAAGFIFTFVSANWCLRKFGMSSIGAAAGAYLFSFPLTLEVAHSQLIYRLWVPPAVLAFDWFFTRRSLKSGACAFLCVALQLAADVYIGMLLLLFLLFYAVALLTIGRRRWVPLRLSDIQVSTRDLMITGLLVISGTIALAVVIGPYIEVQRLYLFTRSWDDVTLGLPRLQSYLLAWPSRLWPHFFSTSSVPLFVEQQLFPGLAAVIALGSFSVSPTLRARYPLAPVMLTALGLAFVFTVYLHGISLYRLIYYFPGFDALRATARIILVMMLPLAVLLGFLVDDLIDVGAGRARRVLAGVSLLVLLVAELSLINTHSTNLREWRAREASLEAQLPSVLPKGAVLAVKTMRMTPLNIYQYAVAEMDAVFVAAVLGIETLNGYSGNSPPNWRPMVNCRDVRENIRAGQSFLANHQQTVPVIGPENIVLVGFENCDRYSLFALPTVSFGHTYVFADDQDGNDLVSAGFSIPEAWGRWIEGKTGKLSFALAEHPHNPIVLRVEATSLSLAPNFHQEADVALNDNKCGTLAFAAKENYAEVTCPAGAFVTGRNIIELRIHNPTKASDIYLNNDYRLLGVGLKTLTMIESQ